MSTKYLGNESGGTPLNASLTRTVVVTNETLNPAEGYEGDVVEYLADMRDDLGVALPESFVADIKFDGVVVLAGVVFSAENYNAPAFELLVNITIPAITTAGAKTVTVAWAEQEI